VAISIMGGGLFVLLFHPELTFSSIQQQTEEPAPLEGTTSQEIVVPTAQGTTDFNTTAEVDSLPDSTLEEPELTRIVREIQQGDTPTSLLTEHLDIKDIYSLCSASEKVYSLEQLRAGQPLVMLLEGEKLVGLEYEIDANERLVVDLQGESPEIRKEPIPYEVRQETIAGTIDGSLWNSMQALGENPALIVRLANLFSWDIDFHREIQPGDSFQLIVDKRFRDGKFAGYGDIHAASFTNAGTTYYAFHYTTSNGKSGYYDARGRSLRKDFLRAPLPFLRVSSGYSMSRMHPILGYRRPHRGVDYAAPKGTPIFAVADGTIVGRGYNRSQGNFIILRHSGGMETIYNHMSRFNSKYRKGSRVKQGAVIGYVGSTGYATGPHLDFRMRIGKKYINPQEYYRKHKATPSTVLSAKEMSRFRRYIATWQAELNRRATAVAQAPYSSQQP
jgi:murein DD-endopeptidase MepM/ murein hydrolase activator NlpD